MEDGGSASQSLALRNPPVLRSPAVRDGGWMFIRVHPWLKKSALSASLRSKTSGFSAGETPALPGLVERERPKAKLRGPEV
jgi:hypothetical protein